MFLFRMPGENANYLQLDLPMEDLAKLPFTSEGRREMVALMSPFIKFPIERIANRNLYFGSDIYNKDLPREYQLSKTLKVLEKLPKIVRDYLNFQVSDQKNSITRKRETVYEMDAKKLHALRSVLAGRFYSTANFLENDELTAWMKAARLFMGVPVRPLDVINETERKDREYNRKLQELKSFKGKRRFITKNDALSQVGKASKRIMQMTTTEINNKLNR